MTIKRVKFPEFEISDNPCVSIITGEFTNVLPDGRPGPSGDFFKPVLTKLVKDLQNNIDPENPLDVPLSPEALAALDAGIKSAQEHPPVDLGSFEQYADDE